MSRRVLTVAVVVGALVLGAAPQALADASGSGGVTQDQSAGTIVVGGSGQEAAQSQGAAQSNDQQLDPNGGTIVGGAQQANGQTSNTNQAIDQTESGIFVVFAAGLHQRANQTADTVQGNDQSVDGGTILGKVDQSNLQTADINQGIHQHLTGTFVVFGGVQPVDPGLAKSFNALGHCGVCSDALSDSSVGLAGGDLHQNAGPHQSGKGTYVVLGNLDQSFSQNSTVAESNDQTVSGSIIIGDVSQANVQHAKIDQGIDQSLTGTYLVFGTLEQSADQVALIDESNHQKVQGG